MPPVSDSTAFWKCMYEVEKYLQEGTSAKIVDAVGGPEAFCRLPVLAFRPEFQQGTYPADGIPPDQVPSPLMRLVGAFDGIEGYPSSTSLVMRNKVTHPDGSQEEGVQHLFKRHRGDSVWTSGTHHHPCPLDSPINDADVEKLRRLVNGESVQNLCYGVRSAMLSLGDVKTSS